MNDQSQMMNQSQQQMMSMSQQLPPLPPSQQNSQMFVNQLMNPSQMMSNQSISNRRGGGGVGGGGYGMWPPPPQVVDQMKFQNPGINSGSGNKPMGIRNNNKNWKMKKGNDKWNNNNNSGGSGSGSGSGNITGAYNPPTLNELQQQNRLKAKRYFPKKKYNHGGGGGGNSGRKAPYAPRNTTSFLIRAKKAGGITSLVSPCPVTPAVLPTPIFSPSREVLVDMAKEEWGVDGYGSMKGLIRLRSPGNEADVVEDEEEDEGGSSESDVEEHVEVERRLDHDLSRFEMIYPNYSGADHSSYNLENRVDDQDTHIAQLEEENLILKERMFLMEREFDDLRMRLQCLERQTRGGERVNNEEVVENDSENESESRGYGRSTENERSQNSEDNNTNNTEAENKQSELSVVATTDVCMEEDIQKTENIESGETETLIETNVSGSNNEETEDAKEPTKEEESAANGL